MKGLIFSLAVTLALFSIQVSYTYGQDYFADVATTYSVNSTEDTWSCSWADIDNNGNEDLLITNTNGSDYYQLYRNDYPAEPFENITGEENCGIVLEGKCNNAVWGDYDNDGDLDVYFCQRTGDPYDLVSDKLFKNNGTGYF